MLKPGYWDFIVHAAGKVQGRENTSKLMRDFLNYSYKPLVVL
jgi:hypothetical protein